MRELLDDISTVGVSNTNELYVGETGAKWHEKSLKSNEIFPVQ